MRITMPKWVVTSSFGRSFKTNSVSVELFHRPIKHLRTVKSDMVSTNHILFVFKVNHPIAAKPGKDLIIVYNRFKYLHTSLLFFAK